MKVIKRIARSHVLTKELYEQSREVLGRGLKVLFPATTRWSSTHIVFERVKKLRSSLAKVCYDNDVDEISTEDFRLIDTVLDITDPFRGFVKKLQQESVPTISLLFAGVRGLLAKLDALKEKHNGKLDDVCQSLQVQIRRRFEDVLNSGTDGHDPIYVAAACLDPAAAQHSNVFESFYGRSVDSIKGMARLLIDGYGRNGEPFELVVDNSKSDEIFGFELPVKRQRLETANVPDKLSVELEEYRAMLRRPIQSSTADFWRQNEHKLSYLAIIARNVLAVPAASSSVERLFSQTTLHSSGHKGRSKHQAIRRKALLSFNDKYINI